MIVTLGLPPSVNNLYYNDRRGGRRLTQEGDAYKNGVTWTLMRASARARCPIPPMIFELWIMVPDRRRRDNSNMIKAIEDAVAAYLGYDDSQNHVLHVYKALDRDNPRAVVRLTHKSEPIPEPPDVSAPGEPPGSPWLSLPGSAGPWHAARASDRP